LGNGELRMENGELRVENEQLILKHAILPPPAPSRGGYVRTVPLWRGQGEVEF